MHACCMARSLHVSVCAHARKRAVMTPLAQEGVHSHTTHSDTHAVDITH